MISRKEFYICYAIMALILIADIFSTDRFLSFKQAKLEMRDSILQAQRDSAIAFALNKEMKADSLQVIINRRNSDIKTIHKKYENEKKNVLVLGADSSLSFFTRSVTH